MLMRDIDAVDALNDELHEALNYAMILVGIQTSSLRAVAEVAVKEIEASGTKLPDHPVEIASVAIDWLMEWYEIEAS